MKWNPCLDMCRFSFLWSKLSFGSFKPKQNLSQFYWVTEGRGSLWPPLTQLSVGLSFSSSLCCTAFWDDCTAPPLPPRLSHTDPVSDELQLTLRVCYLLSPFSNFSVALVNNKSTWFSSRNISFFPPGISNNFPRTQCASFNTQNLTEKRDLGIKVFQGTR